jgi:hypothetical protein
MTLKDMDTLWAYAFATGSIPFFFAENPYFRRAIQILGGETKYELLHRTALRDKVLDEAEKCRDMVKKLVKVGQAEKSHSHLVLPLIC